MPGYTPNYLRLPRELRDQIYLEALTSSCKHIWPCQNSKQGPRLRNLCPGAFREFERNGDWYEARLFLSTALLCVNRQFHDEAKDAIVRANHVLVRPPARWPDVQRTEPMDGNVVHNDYVLQHARSLTLGPVDINQLEAMTNVIKKRTTPLDKLIVTLRRIVYPWNPEEDFPETEREIEDMFACLYGVKVSEVRFEWPTYPCYGRPSLYREYHGMFGAGWPVPVTDRVAKRIMESHHHQIV